MTLNQLKRGVEIIARYERGEAFVCAEHDQLWVGDHAVTTMLMTPEELTEMESLRWFESDGAWSHFT